jgi:hypothetical protein
MTVITFGRGAQVMKLLIMQLSLTSCHFLPLVSDVFSSAPSFQTLSLYILYLSARYQVSHPYKTPSRISRIFFLFILLGSQRLLV